MPYSGWKISTVSSKQSNNLKQFKKKEQCKELLCSSRNRWSLTMKICSQKSSQGLAILVNTEQRHHIKQQKENNHLSLFIATKLRSLPKQMKYTKVEIWPIDQICLHFYLVKIIIYDQRDGPKCSQGKDQHEDLMLISIWNYDHNRSKIEDSWSHKPFRQSDITLQD